MATRLAIIYHKLDLGEYMFVELDCVCVPSSNVLFPSSLCTWKKELCNLTWRYINSLSQNFVECGSTWTPAAEKSVQAHMLGKLCSSCLRAKERSVKYFSVILESLADR